MNTRQFLTLGIGVLVVCFVILSAPKYVYVPHKGSFKTTSNTWYVKKFQPRTDWDWVLQRSLPVILVIGFLTFVLRAGKNSPDAESRQKETDKSPEIALPINRKRWVTILLLGFLSIVSLWVIACLIIDNIEANASKNSSFIGHGYTGRDLLSQQGDIFDKLSPTNNTSPPPQGFVLDQPNNLLNVKSEKPSSVFLSKESFEDAVKQYKAREEAELFKQKLIYEQDLFYQNRLRQQQSLEEQIQKQQQVEWFWQPNMRDAHAYPSYQIGQGQFQKQIQYPSTIQPQSQPIQLPNLSSSAYPVTYIKRGVDAKRIGDTTIYDDDSTAHQIGGTTIFDNGSTARQIGNTTIFDDGSTAKRIGQATIYDDGSTSKQFGSTVIFDDGGTASKVGSSVLSDK